MNSKINKLGYTSIIFFLTKPMFLHIGITELLNSSLNNSIYSCFLGSIISLIILFLIIKIFNYEKDFNIFKKNEKLFYSGKIINLFLVLLFSLYLIYLLYSINAYIQNKYLDSTPSFIIILLFIIPVIWCTSLNMKNISKVSISAFIVCIFVILFSFTNLVSSIDMDNIKPFFNTRIFTILKDSIKFSGYFITPVFLLLLTPKNKIDNINTKDIIIFYIISSLYLIGLFILIIGIFGIDLAKLFMYPEYTLMKKISYFDFIEHIENITTIEWFYTIFISSVLSLNFIKEYLIHINKYNKILYFLIIFICFISSLICFKNTTISFNIVKNYYMYIFFIPILFLLIISNIKIKRNKF